MSRVGDFFESLKEGMMDLAPGLQNIGSDVGAEMGRLFTHGQTEIAAALFTGNGFVLYGQGKNRQGMDANEGIQPMEGIQQEMGGREL